jgi:hypothetical protein
MGVYMQSVVVNGWKMNGTWEPTDEELDAADEFDILWFNPMCDGSVGVFGTVVAEFGQWDDSSLVNLSDPALTTAEVPLPPFGPLSGWDRGLFFVGHCT